MATAVAPPIERIVVPPAAGRPGPPPAQQALAQSLRFAAFAALVLYGCEHWVRQVAPTATRVAEQMALVAVVAAAVFALTGRVPAARRRRAFVSGVAVLAGVAALTAAGIPLRFVGWHNWGEFADGVGEGIGALPNLNVPYRGLDDWVRWTVLSGAALLGVLAAGLAFAGHRPQLRRQVGAALALGALYGIPVVERNPEHPFLSGAGFSVLLALFLGADRLVAIGGAWSRMLAVGGALAALGLAAVVAPTLDAGKPWVDYRGLADDLAKRNLTSFDWNQSYRPLDWPRDGREVLRIKAKRSTYWKATVLQRFDGLRWVNQRPFDPSVVDTPLPPNRSDWYQDLKVTVRSLRSEQYVSSGYTSKIGDVPRPAEAAGSGTWVTAGRALRPGDTYSARTYTPHPTQAQLIAAGTAFPDYTAVDRGIELPASVGGPSGVARGRRGGAQVTTIFPAVFGSTDRAMTFIPGRDGFLGGEELIANSRYARTWKLAQELRAQSRSPLDLVRRVRRRVQQDARYTERPAQRPIPLDAFLFDTHEGYCQQFSGAMALLLRMAGMPARVASGFAPGTLDTDRGQYIVRDLDAHSWVEAFFPGIGWVTLDPTPTVAPPAGQDSGDGGDTAADVAAANRETPSDGADAASGPAANAPAPGAAGDGGSSAPLIGGVLLVALLAAGGVWWWRRPRVPLSALEELRRALVRSGRPATPELTLVGLERVLGGTASAQAYVRKLRLERYAGTVEPPTGAERAALRDELGSGLGVRGRLRAYWALPPKLPPRRAARR